MRLAEWWPYARRRWLVVTPGDLYAQSEDALADDDSPWKRSQSYELTGRCLTSPPASQTCRSRRIARPSHHVMFHPISAVAPRFVPKSVPNTARRKCSSLGLSRRASPTLHAVPVSPPSCSIRIPATTISTAKPIRRNQLGQMPADGRTDEGGRDAGYREYGGKSPLHLAGSDLWQRAYRRSNADHDQRHRNGMLQCPVPARRPALEPLESIHHRPADPATRL